MLRFGAAVIPSIFGIVVRVRRAHRIPSSGALLVVSNHVNIFDGFVLQGHLPVAVRGLELESHFRWPIYGRAMRLFGNIPIPHHMPRIAADRLNRAGRALSRGTSILTFPEGHRTRSGEPGRFMSGPVRFALPTLPRWTAFRSRSSPSHYPAPTSVSALVRLGPFLGGSSCGWEHLFRVLRLRAWERDCWRSTATGGFGISSSTDERPGLYLSSVSFALPVEKESSPIEAVGSQTRHAR